MDKTWLDVLEESSCKELCELFWQLLDNFNPEMGLFMRCPFELDWFRDRGFKFRTICPANSCVKCFYKFLTFKVNHENEGEF